MKPPLMMPKTLYEAIILRGGLDLVTPTLSLKPGVVRDALNFECATTGGYTRVGGYERFDGRAAPSAATYSIFAVVLTDAVTLGATITGVTSGCTAIIIATPSGQLVVTAVSGQFTDGESITIGGTPVGTYTSLVGSSSSPSGHAVYMALAADYYRGLINRVPGSGPVRGVFYYNGSVYAFRNNAGGTACVLHKSSAAGWVPISFEYEVAFTGGGGAVPADGATLAQGGVSATVRRVATQSGTGWTGSAAGCLVISAPSGGNFAAGAANISGGVTLTLSGVQSAITMAPGGHFETTVANFGGSTGKPRVYGCDGVNRAFEFDGTSFVPITTGMPIDAPSHVEAFKNHLMLTFGASLQNSGIGSPFAITATLGASEMSAGENITNLLILTGSQSGGALLVTTRNNTLILYGSSTADFNLVDYNNGVGSLAYTAQNMAGAYSLDDRGIVGLNTTLAYGNFDQASLTSNIRPWIVANRQYAQASSVNREKSQYRAFFSNGYALYATIVNDKYLGVMPMYFPDPVFCAWEGEDGSGNEIAFFGSNDGYVHQLDVGTSHDGQAINAYITLNYDAIKGPRILKRYRKASAEITGSTYAPLSVSYSLGYGDPGIAPQAVASYASDFTVATWDGGFTWDSGLAWDGRTLSPTEIELQGTAENIALTFSNYTNYTGQFTINSVIIHYTPRRGMR